MCNSNLRRVWVKAKLGDLKALRIASKLVKALFNYGIEIYPDPILAKELRLESKGLRDNEVNRDIVDAIIIIGGDGTLLSTIHKIPGDIPPIIGINSDTIGFLYDYGEEDLDKVVQGIIEGKYTFETRTLGMLRFVYPEDEYKYKFLNEVLVINKDAYKLLRFRLYIDNELLYEGRADGIIVSTTTGSSAYALSAGGPLVDPSLEALILVPLAPFSSLLKPVVCGPKREVKVDVMHESVVVMDGTILRKLPLKGEISVKMGKEKILFIKFGRGRELSNKIINRLLDKPWSFKIGN